MEKTIHVLLIEDSPRDARLVRELLIPVEGTGYALDHARSLEDALDKIMVNSYEAILLDLGLSNCQGLEAFQKIHVFVPSVPLLVLTGLDDAELARKALQFGAQDYLSKSEIAPLVLQRAIRYAIERNRVREELSRYARELETRVERRTQQLREANTSLTAEIAEHHRTESALRKAKEFSDSLYISMQEGLCVMDTKLRILDVNPSFCRITGFPRAELLGCGLPAPFWDSEETELIKQAYERMMLGEFEPVELIFERKDGTRFPAIFSPSVVRSHENAVACYLVSIKDISLLKETEAALRLRSEELTERNEELKAFAHTVAHDLKNPLASISGGVGVLSNIFRESAGEDVKKLLKIIERNSRKCGKIVDELLLLAETRVAELRAEPLDMARIVEESLERLEKAISERGVEIILPKSWPSAMGYAPWVEEVWCNYLSNGIRYGGTPPRLEIGAAEMEDCRARFWVRDNGHGLDEAAMEKLFNPGVRLGRQDKKGHGLGLSIVKRIMTRLDGIAGVENHPEGGCIFFFTLPLNPALVQDRLEAAPEAGASG